MCIIIYLFIYYFNIRCDGKLLATESFGTGRVSRAVSTSVFPAYRNFLATLITAYDFRDQITMNRFRKSVGFFVFSRFFGSFSSRLGKPSRIEQIRPV